MSPTDLIASVRRLGASITAYGDRLRVRAPKGALSLELRAALAEQKLELLAKVSDPLYLAEEASWRLSAEGPGWAAVRSHLLTEVVIFLRDEDVTLPPQAARLVTYTKAELAILRTSTPEILREIHRAKRTLPGRVTSLNTIGRVEISRLTP
jgi:hypothetical protein